MLYAALEAPCSMPHAVSEVAAGRIFRIVRPASGCPGGALLTFACSDVHRVRLRPGDTHRASTSHRFRTCGRPTKRNRIILARGSGFHRLHTPAQLNKSGGPRGRQVISEILNVGPHVPHLGSTCEDFALDDSTDNCWLRHRTMISKQQLGPPPFSAATVSAE